MKNKLLSLVLGGAIALGTTGCEKRASTQIKLPRVAPVNIGTDSGYSTYDIVDQDGDGRADFIALRGMDSRVIYFIAKGEKCNLPTYITNMHAKEMSEEMRIAASDYLSQQDKLRNLVK